MKPVYGGIEAGGTKFVCAIGSGPDDIRALETIRVTTPDETLSGAVEYFRQQIRIQPLRAIGIGSFGPVDLNPASSTYGYITGTPKPGWDYTDVVGTVRDALGLQVAFDTDVNAAILGEYLWGVAVGLTDAIYLTVGTGIGGGAIVNGELVHGLLHPEMGHMHVPQDLIADPFEGSCPYHGNCLEGLASGPALKNRWGIAPEDLPDDHVAWKIEARYLAYGAATLTYVLSPQRIVIGGGIMRRLSLLPMIRLHLRDILNGYIQSPVVLEDVESFIVRPALGDRSGVLGALALAMRLDEAPGLQ